MPVTAEIRNSRSEEKSASLGAATNPTYNSVEWRSHRDPDYFVYIYNVSGRTFEDPATGRGMVGRISLKVPGVTDEDVTTVQAERIVNGKKSLTEVEGNAKWHYATSFPQPVLISKFNDESEQIGYIETDAVRFVVDQIHPDNPTRTLDIRLNESQGNPLSAGNNFAEKGVFFSLSNPPLKSDVDDAVKRMETYYNRLLDQAAALEQSDEKQLGEQLRANPDYGYAASYFGRTFKWNKKNVKTVECPNCGEQKPANRLFHTSNGQLCVERSVEGWKAVVEAGFRQYETVPDEFRWRAEPKKESSHAKS